MQMMLDEKIQGCCRRHFVCLTTTINSPQRLARLQNLGLLSEMLCMSDYNSQFPLELCASSKSKETIREVLHVQLQQLIPSRVLTGMFFMFEYNMHVPPYQRNTCFHT